MKEFIQKILKFNVVLQTYFSCILAFLSIANTFLRGHLQSWRWKGSEMYTRTQEEKEAAYRNSKKLLLEKFWTADFPNWQKKSDDAAAEDISRSFSKALTLIS